MTDVGHVGAGQGDEPRPYPKRPDEVDVLIGPFGQSWRDGSVFPRKD